MYFLIVYIDVRYIDALYIENQHNFKLNFWKHYGCTRVRNSKPDQEL
jgi:hypothetical protein